MRHFLRSVRLWFTHPYRIKARALGDPIEGQTVFYKRKPPERTERMIANGFVWTELGDGWTEVCLTCGGNCGQCGTSLGMGNPPKMSRLVESLTGVPNT